ncbi:hypothetical protein EVG20_g9808 [Dentipellis fragilis]|uniref:Deoxyribonuclease NucA/NucB domain-containing protein n=1 Tax=Dentipellis fragilis TaxID=205917 RepID=A0A4Y9XWY4_9AGAM|nr:hypothetical protein EVG20_g9808 [Dentipellis fragilis]
MARATSFATLLTLILFLIAPSILSLSGPLAVSAAVTEPAFDVLNNGVEPVDIAARKASSAKLAKPSTKPPPVLVKSPTKPPTTPVKAPPIKASSVAPVKVTSAAPVKASSAPAKVSSTPVKASSAASSAATSKAATVKASSSVTATSASASASSTSAAACAIKRTGTAGAGAAAACNTCDPCDDSCDTNIQEPSTRKRAVLPEDEPDIRTVYGNDTSPFFPGEHVRVRIVEKRTNPNLEFDCSATGIPEVCVRPSSFLFSRLHRSYRDIDSAPAKHVLRHPLNLFSSGRNHPKTLTRNSANKSKCAAARKLNSCGVASPNRCSAGFKPQGFAPDHSCDEYPFASTLEGQRAGVTGPSAVTRCVPAGENSVQGGKISGIYLKKNSQALGKVADGGQFDIALNFGNGAAGTGYCDPNAATTTCTTLTGSQQNN